jgi:para-nitrobenzyl esterase
VGRRARRHALPPAAPQIADPSRSASASRRAEIAEDCLRLNVWARAPDGGRRPILLWLHGGAFASGSGSAAVYDGARLAARGDAVVATLEYRVGALGFLHVAGLPGFAADCANLGRQDQLAALRWLRAHAERLGDDPERITVFGERCGVVDAPFEAERRVMADVDWGGVA